MIGQQALGINEAILRNLQLWVASWQGKSIARRPHQMVPKSGEGSVAMEMDNVRGPSHLDTDRCGFGWPTSDNGPPSSGPSQSLRGQFAKELPVVLGELAEVPEAPAGRGILHVGLPA